MHHPPPLQGLVYYLPPAAFKGLLSAISSTAAPGSRLFFDFIHLTTMSGARPRAAVARAAGKGA